MCLIGKNREFKFEVMYKKHFDQLRGHSILPRIVNYEVYVKLELKIVDITPKTGGFVI